MARFWTPRHGLCGRRPGATLCWTHLLSAVFARHPQVNPPAKLVVPCEKMFKAENAEGEGTWREQGNREAGGRTEGITRSED